MSAVWTNIISWFQMWTFLYYILSLRYGCDVTSDIRMSIHILSWNLPTIECQILLTTREIVKVWKILPLVQWLFSKIPLMLFTDKRFCHHIPESFQVDIVISLWKVLNFFKEGKTSKFGFIFYEFQSELLFIFCL